MHNTTAKSAIQSWSFKWMAYFLTTVPTFYCIATYLAHRPPIAMPWTRSTKHSAIVPESDTEIIEEVTYLHTTKQGTSIKTKKAITEQPLKVKLTTLSGSRGKKKGEVPICEVEESLQEPVAVGPLETHQYIDDEVYNPGNDDMMAEQPQDAVRTKY